MVERPDTFIFETGDVQEAARDLAERVAALQIEAPFVLASKHGSDLGAQIRGPRPPESPEAGADQAWAVELGTRAQRSGADAIVAIGGGRCLDIGKLAAARAGLTLISVPTQLSHDGIASPVAVVPNEGRTESLGAVEPRALYLALPVLRGAPPAAALAGVGDLMANPLALKDWALAAERGLEEIDVPAWEFSVQAYELIEQHLEGPEGLTAQDPAFLGNLAEALILSGTAMICAGNSRPASGGEHEISHAIDLLHGGRALHGHQVALGAVISTALYGEDANAFRSRLRRLGLPDDPRQIGLSLDDMVTVVLEAPLTRPGRFTILESSDLTRTQADRLVRKIWDG